jgi:putative nucleotidyltransferase with HDIG domain
MSSMGIPAGASTRTAPRERDEAHASRVTVAGRQLATNLAVFWKTSRLYEVRNVAYTQSLSTLVDSLNAMLELERAGFGLQVMSDCLYVNDLRLRVDVVGQASHQFLVDEFARRGLAGIRFSPGFDPTEIVNFSRPFFDWPSSDDPAVSTFEAFEHKLRGLNVVHLWPIRELAAPVEEENDPSQRVVARKSFLRAMHATKSVMLCARQGRRMDLRHAKRAVQSIVDLILSEELSLLGMTTLKDYDEYTYQHCVNVAILAITMGNRLGLSKQQLSQLGVAGLFHDIGKVRIPNAILSKPGKLSPEEWSVMKTHPIEGVKIIAKLHGLSSLAMRAMVTAYEHHLNIDLSGYPRLHRPRSQNLFSRIIAICDCFDAMTAHRSYQKDPFTPYEALHYMTTQLADRFDTTLLKVFIRTVGIYPPGSVVRLNTGEVAVVVFPSTEDVSEPTIKLLRDTEGQACTPERIDLHTQVAAKGRRRVIVDAVRSAEVGVATSELTD